MLDASGENYVRNSKDSLRAYIWEEMKQNRCKPMSRGGGGGGTNELLEQRRTYRATAIAEIASTALSTARWMYIAAEVLEPRDAVRGVIVRYLARKGLVCP